VEQNQQLKLIREKLYNILTAGNDTQGDVKAVQNMGVALSNPIKKEGVNIIQLQSVVNNQVIHYVTEALKLIDEIMMDSIIDITPQEEKYFNEYNDMEVYILNLVSHGYTLKMILNEIKNLTIEKTIEKYGNEKAKQVLRIRKLRDNNILEGPEAKNE
jgi:uncharacterized Ntn-hydrolase superfamily protein